MKDFLEPPFDYQQVDYQQVDYQQDEYQHNKFTKDLRSFFFFSRSIAVDLLRTIAVDLNRRFAPLQLTLTDLWVKVTLRRRLI